MTSLVGGPEVVDNYICGGYAANKTFLASFDGVPEKVESFTCFCTQLTSLEGMPSVSKSVNVYMCPDLVSLAGIRLAFDKSTTAHNVYITNCSKLTSLDGLPDVLYGNFYCLNNGITSLKGCSKKIYGEINLAGLNITDLEGGPTFVKKHLVLKNPMKSLVSLKGAPGKCKGIQFDFVFPTRKIDAYLKWKKEFGTEDNCYPG